MGFVGFFRTRLLLGTVLPQIQDRLAKTIPEQKTRLNFCTTKMLFIVFSYDSNFFKTLDLGMLQKIVSLLNFFTDLQYTIYIY